MVEKNPHDFKTDCQEMRLNLLELAHRAGNQGAHIASSLSEIEILAALFLKVMNKENDYFILSKGHGGLGYYTALFQAGLISKEKLFSFENNGGDLPGQPSKNEKLGIIYSGGTLGVGISYAAGLAMAKKMKNEAGCIYVLLGDGECDEGSVWESAMFASAHHLNNLVVVIDNNKMQSDGTAESVLPINLLKMWMAQGWKTVETDGHDVSKLISSFETSHNSNPLVIIANTIKGKGVSFMENNNVWHHSRLSDSDYKAAADEVRGVFNG
jgi:transketolase